MKKLSMYCLTLNPNHLEKIKYLNYIPVGLGENNFSSNWLTDKTEDNIAKKNSFYGEYTFHYSIWKHILNTIETEWVGFCQYRKFWLKKKINSNIKNLNDLKNHILADLPENINSLESIVGEPFFINQFRLSKFVKRNLLTMVKSPTLFFSKNKRNIKFHFDMWHGKGNLEKAINLLDEKNKNDFTKFVNENVSFNPHNMFICKKEVLINYYNVIFPWLEKCESIFGFTKSNDYGQKRIYGFLAERFLSYWFTKNTKFTTMPILFKDITDLNLDA